MCRLGPERSLDNLSRLADCQLSINRCISHCISSNNKGRTSNWGNNFYWPSQTDLWKLTVPTTTVWAMDWICICCMHFYQYTHCTHIPILILILPHWRSMLFWIRLYLSALFLTSYSVLDREQNYSKCHVFDTSGKLTRDFLRWSGFTSLLTSIISIS